LVSSVDDPKLVKTLDDGSQEVVEDNELVATIVRFIRANIYILGFVDVT